MSRPGFCRRSTAALAAGFVLAVAAIACGGDEPEQLQLGETSEDPDPTAEEPSETDPAPSVEEQRQDAIETVRAWIEASNEASRTLDPEPMLALSTSDCESCQGRADWMLAMEENGEQYEGDFEHQIVSIVPPADEVSPLIVTVESGDWQIIDESGAPTQTAGAMEWTSNYEVEFAEGRWLVAEVYSEE